MHEMMELKEMLEDELNKITKHGKVTAGILDTVDKLTHSIKSIETIMAMEESGYSNDNNSYRIRKDGMRDQRYNYSRDYSRDGDYSNGGYSRDHSMNYGGYSRDLKEDLEQLMHRVGNEEEKRMIKKWMNQLD